MAVLLFYVIIIIVGRETIGFICLAVTFISLKSITVHIWAILSVYEKSYGIFTFRKARHC